MAKENNLNETVSDEVTVGDAPEGTPEGTPEGQVPESIGLQDLQLLAQIVDLASQRGAFRGNELTQVGVVFDKLNAFLGYVGEQQAQAAEAQAEAGDGEEAPAPDTADGE